MMKQLANKQILSLINVPDLSLSRPGRWIPRLALVALTTLCISPSTVAWADSKSFEFSGFDGISAAQEIHVQVTTGKVFQVTAQSDDPKQMKRLKLDVQNGVLRAQMEDGLA